MSLILQPAALASLNAISTFRDAFEKKGEYSIDGSDGLGVMQLEPWHEATFRMTIDSGTLHYFSRQSTSDKLLGILRITPVLKGDRLRVLHGHISCSVIPTARKQGIGTEQVRLALAYLRILGVDKALLTCRADNKAAERVILKVGGILHNTVWSHSDSTNLKRFYVPNEGVNIVE